MGADDLDFYNEELGPGDGKKHKTFEDRCLAVDSLCGGSCGVGVQPPGEWCKYDQASVRRASSPRLENAA